MMLSSDIIIRYGKTQIEGGIAMEDGSLPREVDDDPL